MFFFKPSFILFFTGIAFLVLGVFGFGQSIGFMWSRIDANSLVGFQSLVDTYFEKEPGNPTFYFDNILPILNHSLYFLIGIKLIIISYLIRLFKKV